MITLIGTFAGWNYVVMEHVSSYLLNFAPAMPHPNVVLGELTRLLIEVTHDDSDPFHAQDQFRSIGLKQLVTQLSGLRPCWPLSKTIECADGHRQCMDPMTGQKNSTALPMFKRPGDIQSGGLNI